MTFYQLSSHVANSKLTSEYACNVKERHFDFLGAYVLEKLSSRVLKCPKTDTVKTLPVFRMSVSVSEINFRAVYGTFQI